MTSVVRLDADLKNADWVKKSPDRLADLQTKREESKDKKDDANGG